VKLTIVFKTYDDSHVTAAIRANSGAPIAGTLAEHMGGGGHDYASGFKTGPGQTFTKVKTDCLEFAAQLLDNLNQEANHETV
jgi:nanoRNase/pAp phosphatase (c-di-AMP/oligoRNAs hydrolase)